MRVPFFDVSAREARQAARLALQSAVAAAAIFGVLSLLSLPEKFVGVISAVLVVQPSVGNTIGEVRDRMMATAVGSAVGIACLLALPSSRGGWTALALALSMLATNGVAAFRPAWRYGVVAAVALSLGAEEDALATAGWRALSIGMGGLTGVLASLVVWPDSARARAQAFLEEAIDATSLRLHESVRGARGEVEAESDDTERARTRYHPAMEGARQAVEGIVLGQTETIKREIREVEKLYNSTIILDRVAEETDEAGAGGTDIGDHVEVAREHARALVDGLTDGGKTIDEGTAQEHLDALEEAIQAAREEAATGEREAKERVFEHTLVFGLGEVYDSLRALYDLRADDQG